MSNALCCLSQCPRGQLELWLLYPIQELVLPDKTVLSILDSLFALNVFKLGQRRTGAQKYINLWFPSLISQLHFFLSSPWRQYHAAIFIVTVVPTKIYSPQTGNTHIKLRLWHSLTCWANEFSLGYLWECGWEVTYRNRNSLKTAASLKPG